LRTRKHNIPPVYGDEVPISNCHISNKYIGAVPFHANNAFEHALKAAFFSAAALLRDMTRNFNGGSAIGPTRYVEKE